MANRIHPTAIIGAGVELGDDNLIGPYVVITGPCVIGDGNHIGPHTTIGGPAESLGAPHPAGWDDEVAGAGVIIGDRNIIRESVTIHQGTHEPTRIGNDCYLMAQSHVGHDGQVDDFVVLTSAVQIAGHARVWSRANVGMGTVVHQRAQIGPGAMVGMASAVRKDVPPYTVTVGNPARAVSINTVGLSRRGLDEAQVAAVELYLKGKAPLPDGLPAEVSDQLTEWAKINNPEN
ncbi:hypothetical protein [Longispora albida]|uniref:hypothetical protein n=1 Tax=Longispora albida TaxID=203523 RepID=UPI0003780CA5|nr:hypothetical protein [Longispora albida]